MHDLELAVDFLRTVLPFDDLDPEALRWLAGRLEAAYYPRGKVICASRPAPGLAIIRKGAVRLVDAAHRFLDRRSEGELFGHGIWFHGEQKDYVAEAEEDCLVWHLEPADFATLCAQQARIAAHFGDRPATRLSEATRERRPVTRLRDLLTHRAVSIESRASIGEAARLMSRENVSSVLVMRDGRLAGIVTDKDLRQRVLAPGLDTSRTIHTVMTASPVALPADADLDEALLLMMRHNCHHLPVVEGRADREHLVGLVTAGDILRAQSEHPLRLVRDIHRQGSTEELQRLSRRLPALFVRLVSLGRDAEQVGRMVTQIADAFTVRLLQLAEARIGKAPMGYAWVAFGSQAREEQSARSDQDNGLVLERDPDEAEARYFEQLARFVCGGLDQLGYPYCPGEIMALNPRWRVSLAQWRRHFDGWIDEPEPKAVMHSSIFFDMRCVHGVRRLVDELLEYAVERAGGNQIFRRFMAANVLTHRPPIGFFRRLVQEADGSHSEGLNLKHRGIVPITDLARMRALEAGVTAANSYRRLEQAAAAGLINAGDAASLRDALNLVAGIRLGYQAERLAAGEIPGNLVPPEQLSPLLRRNLRAAFILVLEAQNVLALRYQVL
ncbi:MAG: cyclic nucleotide-binding/CBS domain-containing protein [Lysobacterales bacterium]|nr:MAG: cyclic nucleotide-binding/CBS domain-containing protein [Xanthomonadales bacterium]